MKKLQRTDIEEKELRSLSKNQIRPGYITGIEIADNIEKSYMKVIKIDYEQGTKDKELIFEININ